MPKYQMLKDDRPTYENAISGSFPSPLLQQSLVGPQSQASQAPDHRQTRAYHIPYSHFDDSLYIPLGLFPLLSMHSLTISTKSDCAYNIKNTNKLVFTAETSVVGNCSKCCDKITIRTIDGKRLALCEGTINEIACCSEPHRSIAVSFPHNCVIIGRVIRIDYHHFAITNQYGDVVLTIEGKSKKTFKIYAHDGTQIGSIERTEGTKNKLIFPRDLAVRLKILLLATAIHIQEAEAEQGKK